MPGSAQRQSQEEQSISRCRKEGLKVREEKRKPSCVSVSLEVAQNINTNAGVTVVTLEPGGDNASSWQGTLITKPQLTLPLSQRLFQVQRL